MSEMTNTSLAERDQLNRLLKYLETEATIGPGNEPKVSYVHIDCTSIIILVIIDYV